MPTTRDSGRIGDRFSTRTVSKYLEAELRREERQLRKDLTPEQREEALRIGRIEFQSAGATRKR
jgi:hypothetical protein